ncbi:hypothetical protein X797_010295 [Metarhizium robertsii]|uniref:Uncharacterized protein n=1 Tax=Metarhizium robertsii TaxID=568076 RepID=A0A014MY94_9HYPO|nr:hypothetical protein X797_010295 [Metarhizium robertsii]
MDSCAVEQDARANILSPYGTRRRPQNVRPVANMHTARAAPPPRVNDAQQPSAPRRDESEKRPKKPSRTLGSLTKPLRVQTGTDEQAAHNVAVSHGRAQSRYIGIVPHYRRAALR